MGYGDILNSHLGPTATPRETIEKASKIMVSQPAAQGSLRAPWAPWMQGKRRSLDKQVYPVTAFFRLPERLGGPPETLEKAWKSMHFPAWRPGATRGLRETWKTNKPKCCPSSLGSAHIESYRFL